MNKALTINFCPSSEVCENSTQINDLNLVVGFFRLSRTVLVFKERR